jgi:hypothetical protein
MAENLRQCRGCTPRFAPWTSASSGEELFPGVLGVGKGGLGPVKSIFPEGTIKLAVDDLIFSI